MPVTGDDDVMNALIAGRIFYTKRHFRADMLSKSGSHEMLFFGGTDPSHGSFGVHRSNQVPFSRRRYGIRNAPTEKFQPVSPNLCCTMPSS